MPDYDTCVGNQPVNRVFEFVQLGNTVVDEKNLSASAHLEVNRFFDNVVVESVYFGLDRVTIGRRGRDNRKVACTH